MDAIGTDEDVSKCLASTSKLHPYASVILLEADTPGIELHHFFTERCCKHGKQFGAVYNSGSDPESRWLIEQCFGQHIATPGANSTLDHRHAYGGQLIGQPQ